MMSRLIERMGHQVRQLSTEQVKAFCRVHKSNGHDAIAITEAADRPGMQPVPIKTVSPLANPCRRMRQLNVVYSQSYDRHEAYGGAGVSRGTKCNFALPIVPDIPDSPADYEAERIKGALLSSVVPQAANVPGTALR